MQPLTQTKPSRQIIGIWGSRTALTLLKSGSSWWHVLRDSALPCAAATRPVALAQSNCERSHHEGYESWLSITLFPHNSLLNESSSSVSRSKREGGVRQRSPVFSGPFAKVAPGTPSGSRRGHNSSPASQLLTDVTWLFSSSFSEASVLFFKGGTWQQFANRQWCWHLEVHICK